jgi:hypothetical protein
VRSSLAKRGCDSISFFHSSQAPSSGVLRSYGIGDIHFYWTARSEAAIANPCQVMRSCALSMF